MRVHSTCSSLSTRSNRARIHDDANLCQGRLRHAGDDRARRSADAARPASSTPRPARARRCARRAQRAANRGRSGPQRCVETTRARLGQAVKRHVVPPRVARSINCVSSRPARRSDLGRHEVRRSKATRGTKPPARRSSRHRATARRFRAGARVRLRERSRGRVRPTAATRSACARSPGVRQPQRRRT